MTLSDDDLVQITVEQTLLGEDIINIFYYLYKLSVVGAEILDMLDDFRTNVWFNVRGSQHPDMKTNAFVGENLTDGVTIDTLNVTLIGTDVGGGPVLPTYVAAGYSLDVASKLTRPGSKRFCGIPEDRVTNNDYDASGTVSDVIETSLAAVVAVTGAVSGSGDMQPVIIGRDTLGHLDLTRFQSIASSGVKGTIRSQVSRRS